MELASVSGPRQFAVYKNFHSEHQVNMYTSASVTGRGALRHPIIGAPMFIPTKLTTGIITEKRNIILRQKKKENGIHSVKTQKPFSILYASGAPMTHRAPRVDGLLGGAKSVPKPVYVCYW
jgi:hypothetical protein